MEISVVHKYIVCYVQWIEVMLCKTHMIDLTVVVVVGAFCIQTTIFFLS